jgi:hypothetical protein
MGYNTLSSALSRRPSPLDGSYGYGLVDVHVGWDRCVDIHAFIDTVGLCVARWGGLILSVSVRG